MKITVNKTDLLRAVSIFQGITDRKTTMPILSSVLITADKSNVKFSATDLEMAAVVSLKANVEKVGKVAVNAKFFADIVRELPDGEISLNQKDKGRLLIGAGKAELSVNITNPDEYPALPGIALDPASKIVTKLMSEMIDSTLYATSTDETKYVLNGVCFESTLEKVGSKLRLVSTDGHRLSYTVRDIETLKLGDRVVVPRRGLLEIKKILDSELKPEVGFDIRDNFIIIEGSDAKIAVRLIDGEFPNYEQVIPKVKGTVATVDKDQFFQALKRSVLVVTDKGKKIELNITDGMIRLISSSAELGEANEEVTADYKGELLRVGFNAKFIIDTLNSYSENGPICIEFFGENGPCKIFRKEDENSIAVIMPMRLD